MSEGNGKLFALVDCNNFYVSCERVFNPRLRGRPVIVMSNNDGCVVSRSNEVKSLGIPMGAPVFKCRETVRRHRIRLLSSNYALYGDMSERVMKTLSQFTPQMEIYSIDEAFLLFEGFGSLDVTGLSHRIRKTVLQWTGIPVSIGIARTKTLAKIANRFAKKFPGLNGVLDFTSVRDKEKALSLVPVGSIWGVGRKYAQLLEKEGIENALQFSRCNDTWIRKKMKVDGLRTVYELRGKSCIALDGSRSYRKSVVFSRSFGRPVFELSELEESVALYAARASQKLRKDGSVASYVCVYAATNRYREGYSSGTATVSFDEPSAHEGDVIRAALKALRRIYRKNHFYKKTAVILTGIIPDSGIQQNLFRPDPDPPGKMRLTMAMDSLNSRFGRETVRYGATGIKRPWQMKRERCSPRYTTAWNELPVASA